MTQIKTASSGDDPELSIIHSAASFLDQAHGLGSSWRWGPGPTLQENSNWLCVKFSASCPEILNSFPFFFSISLLVHASVCTCDCMHACATVFLCAGQGVGFLLPPRGNWGLNSGLQACPQEPLKRHLVDPILESWYVLICPFRHNQFPRSIIIIITTVNKVHMA